MWLDITRKDICKLAASFRVYFIDFRFSFVFTFISFLGFARVFGKMIFFSFLFFFSSATGL
jgi:hypothetical protein